MAGRKQVKAAAEPLTRSFTTAPAPRMVVTFLSAVARGEDGNGGDHGDKAFGNAFHYILKGEYFSADEVGHDQDKGNDASPRQSDIRVGFTERINEAGIPAEGTITDIQQPDDAGDNEDNDRQDQIDDPSICRRCGFTALRLCLHGLVQRPKFSFGFCTDLKVCHFSVIESHERQEENEGEREQRIEVIRNGTDEELNAGHIEHR